MNETILVVDDEEAICQSLQGILSDEGYEVLTAQSGEECLDMIEEELPSLVLLDIWLPGIDGIETLKRIKAKYPQMQVIMISGHGTVESAVTTTKLGAFDFVEKPLSLEKTLLAVNHALDIVRLEEENRRLKKRPAARYRRRKQGDYRIAGDDTDHRAHQRVDPDHGRERHGEGTRRPIAAPAEQPFPKALYRGELRRDPGRADRERALRP